MDDETRLNRYFQPYTKGRTTRHDNWENAKCDSLYFCSNLLKEVSFVALKV